MATIDENEPKVRPFGFVMIHSHRLYFCTNNQKAVYHQMQENPSIEICACAGAEWVRVKGSVVFDEDKEAKKQVFIADPDMSNLYRPEDDIFKVFYLEHVTVTFADMSGRNETETF